MTAHSQRHGVMKRTVVWLGPIERWFQSLMGKAARAMRAERTERQTREFVDFPDRFTEYQIASGIAMLANSTYAIVAFVMAMTCALFEALARSGTIPMTGMGRHILTVIVAVSAFMSGSWTGKITHEAARCKMLLKRVRQMRNKGAN